MSLNLGLGFSEFSLKMANPTDQNIYEFGDFRLDAGHLMLSRGGNEMQTAPKAVETLLALVQRRGVIVSKDELLDAVWPGTAVEESNLFLYLSVLRKTLETQPDGQPWIETLRRRGYRFNGDVQVSAANGANLRGGEPLSTPVPPDASVATDQQDPASWRQVLVRPILAIVVVCVLIGALAFTFPFFSRRAPITSVAVMPFANETGDPEIDYMAGAMTDDLIGKLANIPNLEVRSSSAVYDRYKGKQINAKIVGQELGVRAVLNGRLTKRGNETVLNLELVDTETENSLWNYTYGKESANLAAIDRKVTRDVIRELNISLTPEIEKKLARDYEANVEAYAHFRIGRMHLRRLVRSEVEKGLEQMQKAIDLDPTYALAYAGLAEAYRALCVGAEMPPHETCRKSKDAALKAIQLDEGLAEGYAALSHMATFYDWDFKEAERLAKRAVELNPNCSTAHLAYGEVLSRIGRKEEAAEHQAALRKLEPLSPMFNVFGSGAIKDPVKQLEQVRFAIDLDPTFYFSYYIAGGIYRGNKMYPEAFKAYQIAKEIAPEQTWSDVTGFVPLLIEMGRRNEAEKIVNDMIKRSETQFVSPGNIAIALKNLGRTDEAFEWLEKGYHQRDPRMVNFKTGPIWQDVQEDPRMKDLLKRIGFD